MSTNMKGSTKAAAPSFRAWMLVFMKGALAMPAATMEASATGGVMAEMMPK